MSLTQAFNISVGAMGVHQNVINITSNNIANMNTEGYHKQKAQLGTLVLGLPIGESVSRQVKTSAGV
ncbi:MAG: flagellar basal body protein, partial [Candidatus Gastranaerophilaceae bacterium]